MNQTDNLTGEEQFESLGTLFKRTRSERGITLEQIIDETKISASNLRAMEADDLHALPADAFAKGFYALYARALQLNPDEIVARFLMERRDMPAKEKRETGHITPLPGKMAKQVSSMAEPTGVSPVSTIGFVLLLLVILAGGICWYLSINPAAYLSEKLRGIQNVESTQGDSPAPPADGSTN